MIAPLLQRKWRRHFGTRFRWKNRPSGELVDKCRDRRTPKVPSREPTTKPNQPSRQTILYVPLPGFWLSGRVFAGVGVAICCTLFTNCCKPSKSCDSASRLVLPISTCDEANSSKFDDTAPQSGGKKSRYDSGRTRQNTG